MGLLELLIIICVLAWATGTFIFPVGNVIHLLILIIVIILIVRLARGEQL